MDNCPNPADARGWCGMHYQRWRRKGSPHAGPISVYDRFMLRVDKTGSIPEARPEVGPCWVWTGSRLKGYGMFREAATRQVGAHRWLYEHLHGPVGALDLDHLCRVRQCVNPDHLEPVTRRENLRRGIRADSMGARTHCPQGHPYDEANTGRAGNERWCRTCKRDRARQRRGRLARDRH